MADVQCCNQTLNPSGHSIKSDVSHQQRFDRLATSNAVTLRSADSLTQVKMLESKVVNICLPLNAIVPRNSTLQAFTGVCSSVNKTGFCHLHNLGLNSESWSVGVVGYHVRLTRERSPVRARDRPLCHFALSADRNAAF